MYKYFLIVFLIFLYISSDSQNRGCIWGDCINGKGKYIFDNGTTYEGEFKKGQLNGYGKLVDPYNNTYIGFFKNNKFDSVGMFLKNDGSKYIGQFKDGKRNGLGTQYYSDNYKEKGLWQNDKFIEEKDFKEFEISEPYSFCSPFLEILSAIENNFESIKGDLINPLLKNQYKCKIIIKEVTAPYITDKNEYHATYFKGDYIEAQKKYNELNNIIKKCFHESCYKVVSQPLISSTKQINEYSIISTFEGCNKNAIGAKVTTTLLQEKNLGKVEITISK
ncbi:MAG: hypothetical protein N3A01_07920 [Bacteroidales bacterium]|nr:hypothetical protein [Bacteroidales bacterium]